MIYVMKWNGLYKIGCTHRSIKQRWGVKRLRENIVLTIDTGDESPYVLEAKLHRQFAHVRTGAIAELFALDEQCLAELLSMPNAKPYVEE